jgi:hypothetical protein
MDKRKRRSKKFFNEIKEFVLYITGGVFSYWIGAFLLYDSNYEYNPEALINGPGAGILFTLPITLWCFLGVAAKIEEWLNPQLNPEQVLAQRMESRRQRLEKENNET